MSKKAVLITGIAAAAVILGGARVAVAASTQTADDQLLSWTGCSRQYAALARTVGEPFESESETAPQPMVDIRARWQS